MDTDDPLKSFTLDSRTTEQRLFNTDDTLAAATHGLELLESIQFEITDPGFLAEARARRFREIPPVQRQAAAKKLHMGLRILSVFGPATTLALQSLKSTEPTFAAWWEPRSRALRADPLSRYFWDMRVDMAHRGSAGLYHVNTALDLQVLEGGNLTCSATISLLLHESPRPDEDDAYTLGTAYLETLGGLVSEAWREFSPITETLGVRPQIGRPTPKLIYTPAGGQAVEVELERVNPDGCT